jgi:hypothetical protein
MLSGRKFCPVAAQPELTRSLAAKNVQLVTEREVL